MEYNKPILEIMPHEQAPFFQTDDARLKMEQIISEVKSGNFSTNPHSEFYQLFRQLGFVNLWVFLTLIAGYDGPYELLTDHLHAEMTNFYQNSIYPGAKAACLIGRSHYKDLACNTPMLTSNRGWTTHRDLVVGDYVYSPDGKPVAVEAVTETYFDSSCLRITFDDGAQITCGEGHLWRVLEKHRRGPARTMPVVTREPVIKKAKDLSLRMNVGSVKAPLQMQEKDLPLDPYVLGVWLGNGTSTAAIITAEYDDAEFYREIFAKKGYPFSERKSSNETTGTFSFSRSYGTAVKNLRKLGVYDNKHIPDDYLSSSIEQRWELLQGLMDTNGSSKNTTATFVNKSKHLAEDVFSLAQSLGLRPRFRKHHLTLHGEKYEFYHVSFQHYADCSVFKLERKQKKASENCTKRFQNRIKSIEKIESVPTNCIQVEGGMYLAGKMLTPTHNSSVFTHGGNSWEILRDPNLSIALGCGVEERALEFLGYTIDTFTSNPLFAWLYPEYHIETYASATGCTAKILTLPNKQKNRRTPNIKAMTAGGSTAGIHADLLKLDDIITDTDLDSERKSSASMYQMANWLKSSIRTLVKDWRNSRVFLSGTRYAPDDAYEAIMLNLKKKVGYWDELPDHYEVKEDGEWDVYYRMIRENGRIIFPESFTEPILQKLEVEDPWTYWTQYVNNPFMSSFQELNQFDINECKIDYTPSEGFKVLYFYNGVEQEWNLRDCHVIQVLDPAASERGMSAKTSRSAHIVLATAPDGRMFVIRGHADYVPASKIFDWLFETFNIYKNYLKLSGMEMQGPFKVFEGLMRDEQNKRRQFINFRPIKTQGDKDARIRTQLEPVLRESKLYCIPSFKNTIKAELKVFPDSPKKDVLDALSMAVQESRIPEHPNEIRKRHFKSEITRGKVNATTGY